MAVKPVPDGFNTVTPYLLLKGVKEFIQFLEQAFNGNLTECSSMTNGEILHAQVKIGDSIIMMGEIMGDQEPVPSALYLYVEDADAVYKRAIEAGADSLNEPRDEFYGDRTGGVRDKWGNIWWVSTHIEDVSPDELQKRAEAYRG